MGRKAKPTALKELAGNPGKRALPKDEPRPDIGLPEKPKGLTKIASDEWDRLAPQLDKIGLLTKIDRTAFIAYCECLSDYYAAQEHIKKYGRVQKVNGLFKKNPSVQMKNDSLRLMRQYLIEFGLTPSARTRVASQMSSDPRQLVLPGTDKESVDPNKPKMPEGPFSDESYFDFAVRH